MSGHDGQQVPSFGVAPDPAWDAAQSLSPIWSPTMLSPALPFVHLLNTPAEARRAYDRLLAGAEFDVLSFNRPPYSVGPVNPAVLDALDRGVSIRALYQPAAVEGADADDFRQIMETYDEAGVQGRIVVDLPVQLAIVDRSATLLAMSDPRLPAGAFRTVVLIEHSGFSAVQAYAFEQLWTAARPYRRRRRVAAVANRGG